jgi:hypothetical protein
MRAAKYIFNLVLACAIGYAAVFLWVRYFIGRLWLAAVVTAVITGAVVTAAALLGKRLRGKRAATGLRRVHLERVVSALCFVARDTVLGWLADVYGGAVQGGAVIAEADGARTVVIPCFDAPCIAEREVLAGFHAAVGADALVLWGTDATKEAYALGARLPTMTLTLVTGAAAAERLEAAGIEVPLPEPPPRKRARGAELARAAFCRARCKGYFFSALSLVFAALFVPYSLYYRIFASVLLLCALLSLFNPTFRRARRA